MRDYTPTTEQVRRATADFSPDLSYRYRLTRTWDQCLVCNRPPAVFVMLNPSTADASLDDPTIRRCVGFAKAWGCPGLTVVNLYALRSADPKALWSHPDPVGPDNNRWISEVLLRAWRQRAPLVGCFAIKTLCDHTEGYHYAYSDLREALDGTDW